MVAVLVVAAVVCVALVLLIPHSSTVPPSATFSGDREGSVSMAPAGPQTGGLTAAPVMSIPGSLPTTAPAALSPSVSTIPTVGTTLDTTTLLIVPAATFFTATPTTVPTEIPTTRPTSQITLAVTHVPIQPPTSSVTSSSPGAPALDPKVIESRIHDMINTQREKNGLAPLSYDPFLADIARGHSWDMVTRDFFDHINPDGKNARARGDNAGYPCIRYYKSYSTLGIAENLFQGNRYRFYYTNTNDPNGTVTAYDWNSAEQIADTAVAGWMNNTGHRENILTSSYSLEGIGVAFAPDDKIYVTENFC
ncbi:MAG: CAP domain-containing protein [Methanoregula sp.]